MLIILKINPNTFSIWISMWQHVYIMQYLCVYLIYGTVFLNILWCFIQFSFVLYVKSTQFNIQPHSNYLLSKIYTILKQLGWYDIISCWWLKDIIGLEQHHRWVQYLIKYRLVWGTRVLNYLTILSWGLDSISLKCLKNMKTIYPDEKNVVLDENSVERKPCINRESMSLELTI